MTEFNVGNRVRYTGRHPRGVMSVDMIGRIGTITDTGHGSYSIEWDNYPTERQGWLAENLELLSANSLRTLWSTP